VTHVEREDAVERLRAAYAMGCLDDTEFDERTTLAYAAKTRGQLAGLFDDLPPVPPSEIAARSTAARSPAGNWGSRARRRAGQGCWLMLTAAGTWLIALVAGGIAAVLLIFVWLVVLRLGGKLYRLQHGPAWTAQSRRRRRWQ
jgi:hypothetical protein